MVYAPAVRIDVLARVRSPDGVTSPLSGRRGAFVHLEVLELGPDPLSADLPRVLGERILGDVVTLEFDLGSDLGPGRRRRRVDVVVRRAELRFALLRPPPTPLTELPAELASLVGRSRGGLLAWREHVVRQGDCVRLRAFVEEQGHDRLGVRDDLGRVELHEVVDGPFVSEGAVRRRRSR